MELSQLLKEVLLETSVSGQAKILEEECEPKAEMMDEIATEREAASQLLKLRRAPCKKQRHAASPIPLDAPDIAMAYRAREAILNA